MNFDLMRILKGMLRYWWMLVIAVPVTVGTTYVFVARQQPIYRTSTTIEILPSPSLGDSQMINIINVLSGRRTTLNTFARKATSGTMKERVASRLNLPNRVVWGAGISASVLPETTLIEIRARATKPELAAAISDAVAYELINQVPDKVMVIEIIDYASVPTDPIEPQPERSVTLAAVTGVVLGLGFALLATLVEIYVIQPRWGRPSPTTPAPLPEPQQGGVAL